MLQFENCDYFSLLDLPHTFSQDKQTIKAHYLALQRKIHPDNFSGALQQEKNLAIRYASIVNDAYNTLSDTLKRALYILKLAGVDTQSETDCVMPMDFLEEQMALHETLADLKQKKDLVLLLQLKEQIGAKIAEYELKIGMCLDKADKDINLAKDYIRQMQFYLKFQTQLAQQEEMIASI